MYPQNITLATHNLKTYSKIKPTKYLVVFESGLGADHSIWHENDLANRISETTDVLLYDRAGYGNSETGPYPRNIDNLRKDLEFVIDNFSDGRKVILVGHSLGGLIIRDYAIKNPEKTGGLIFVDPSHEDFEMPTQHEEALMYQNFKTHFGAKFGGTMEARFFIEDLEYCAKLPNLPNIPVVVLSSMKTDERNSIESKEKLFADHNKLGTGVDDFTHVKAENAGHFIMVDAPELIIESVKKLFVSLH